MKGVMIRVLGLAVAVVLTAKLGRVQFNGHDETFYNLNMSRIVEKADAYYGLSDVYAVREDGVKTYNGLVMVAANFEVHPYGSLVETSRGLGIVLDTGDFAKSEPTLIDIAVTW